MWVSINTHIFFFGQLRNPRSNNIPVAMSKFSVQKFISNNAIFQKRIQIILGEMAGSKIREENIQDELGLSYSARKKVFKTNAHDDGNMSKGHGSQLKWLPVAKLK